MKTAGQELLEDMRALEEALGGGPEPLEELDLSSIWRGVRNAAKNAVGSFKRGYARGSGKPLKAKRLPDDTKADADAVPVAAKRLPDDTKADADAVPISGHEPKPKAEPKPAPKAEPKAAKPPRAGKPDDKTAKPAAAKPAAKPAADKPQAKCKPLKGRAGRFKCTSPSGQVYYKDSAGGVRRLK